MDFIILIFFDFFRKMLSKEAIVAKLESLVDTAVSIQSTGAWVLFHKRQCDLVVSVWSEYALSSSSSSSLSSSRLRVLLYLANDVLQSAARRALSELAARWAAAVPPVVAAAAAAAGHGAELSALRRLLSVWRDRAVLPHEALLQCEKHMPPEQAPAVLVATTTTAAAAAAAAAATSSSPSSSSSTHDDPRVAQLAALWRACDGAAPSPALAEQQRALADLLFREAQAAVLELEKTEAALLREQTAAAPPEKKLKPATPLKELIGNPKLLHEQTLDLLAKLRE